MNINPSLAIKGAVDHAEAELTSLIDEHRRIQRKAMGDERDANGMLIPRDRDMELRSASFLAAYRTAYRLVADMGAKIDRILESATITPKEEPHE